MNLVRGTLLEGRRALVTGAGRGIGRAIAIAIAAEGAAVAVNDRDSAPADDVVSEIVGAGGRAVACSVPIDDHEAARAMVAEVAEQLGGLDLLVNNAGIPSSGRRVELTPVSELESLLAVHTIAPFVLVQPAIPLMRSAGGGDIVMISSTTTEWFGRNSAPYTMAKAALEALAYTLAKEEERSGIRVNIVAPGTFDTRLGREITDRFEAARRRRGEADGRALTLGDPAVVARAVVAVTAAGADGVTGERHRVMG
jgi:3-oxoacyl-[acyl-carrier protein] reductase